MNIVGLGHAGCQIAKDFENYEQYRVFCIDVENKGYSTFLPVEQQISHEDYEKNYKKLNLSECKGETTLIVSGAGDISGCCLRVLEQLNHNPTTIIYIKSDNMVLAREVALRDRVTFNVLQNYTRSAVFENMYIISNKLVESVISDSLSIKHYWRDINNIISSTYHMLNVFSKTEPLLTTVSKKHPTARIGTLGVINYDSNKEKLFYDLQYPRIKNYFYGVNEQTLGEDKSILHDIRSFVEKQSDKKTDARFAIYSTNYERNYIYSTHYASFIQEQKTE